MMAVLILCIYQAVIPADVALVAADFRWGTTFFEDMQPRCMPNEIPIPDLEECMRRAKPAAIRNLRETGLRASGECGR